MSNYNFTLDMGTDNSNSLILRNIKPNSVVLELGSAFGRMTKYLKEQLNCQVVIVEKDEGAGKVAAQYAVDAIIGEEQGDLEKPWWSANLAGKKFDYIICADVLEHLVNPEKILVEAKLLLKDAGSILLSIPNIAHNAVLIDLLQDKFEYRDVGILDKTHVKFFTYNSLKSFIAAAGFSVVKEMNAINVVSNTEFKNSYLELPTEVANFLQSRKMGEVYQFIWELKRSDIELSIITPVFGKWNFTKSYLNDLMRLDAAKVEIIIIDNASTDETSANLADYEKKMPNLKVIRNNINMFHSKACNQGYKMASGKYILFLNNDIRIKNNHNILFTNIIDACTANTLVGPTMGLLDNAFNFIKEANQLLIGNSYISGWCIAGSKDTWDKIDIGNGQIWSEKYPMYFNDGDLSFRSKKANIQLKIVDLPGFYHFGKISSSQINIIKLYQDGKRTFIKDYK